MDEWLVLNQENQFPEIYFPMSLYTVSIQSEITVSKTKKWGNKS